jgi:ribosomal RNA-processing protein 9
MSLNTQGTILATGSADSTIKLWDTQRNLLIDTLKSHKSDINGIKFGYNSNNLCSVSSDRTFKLWDAAERAFIDTFYGHK